MNRKPSLLAEVSYDEAKMHADSFLPRRERPLLAENSKPRTTL